MKVAVCVSEGGRLEEGAALAERLGVSLIEDDAGGADCDADVLVMVTGDGIGIRAADEARGRLVMADFVRVAYSGGRRMGGDLVAAVGGKGQPLARAVGMGKGGSAPLRVTDATAGLGADAFRLACLGCEVTAVERSEVVVALLEDAVRRAGRIPELAEVLERFRVVHGDSRDYLAGLIGAEEAGACDVVYLDPMYPARGKSSPAVRKEMVLFRKLVGDDADAEALLEAARRIALQRVVVKRLPEALILGGRREFWIEGKTVRYDVYTSLST